MIPRRALGAIFAFSLAAVPAASAVEGAPLLRRDGVVVAWQARSHVAVVVTGDQRVYAVHALRKVAPGTRVQVGGVKWGTPTTGIKWSTAPSGIKWGIKWGRNGTYASRLTTLPGKATTLALRGTVVRRIGTSGVVVSVPGATFPIALRRAVWLPGGGKRLNAVTPLGRFGAKVTVRVNFDARGRISTSRVIETASAGAQATAPLAGRVIAVDVDARTITVRAGTVALPAVLTISLPPNADMNLYPVGAEVSSLLVKSAADGRYLANELSLNATFAQADSPVSSIVAPGVTPSAAPGTNPPAQPGGPTVPTPPNPAFIAAATDLQTRWVQANTDGLIPNLGVFTAQRNRLGRIVEDLNAGNQVWAVAELVKFDTALNGVPAVSIDTAFRDQILAAAAALRVQLV